MNLLKQFNDAMGYIEQQLLSQPDMDIAKVAQVAGCSEYYFRRMFSFLAGMSLGEYIRRRKLSLAVGLLQSGCKVIDLALQLGYESPEAFSKAFGAMHGIPPSQARKESVTRKAFPPMTFRLTIQGGTEMEYRIVQKDAFQIVGFKKRITLQFMGVNPQMAEVTARLTPEIIAELKGLCDTEPVGMLSVSANFTDRTVEGTELDQYIGVATTKPAPDGYDRLEVKPMEWAVFSVCGAFPDALQDTWGRIASQWFPSSGYQLAEGPELLWNESPDTTKPDYKSEIWIPVQKLY